MQLHSFAKGFSFWGLHPQTPSWRIVIKEGRPFSCSASQLRHFYRSAWNAHTV